VLYVGVCKSCYPKICIIGWATQPKAWRGIHHTGHPRGLGILVINQIPMLKTQIAIESKLFKIANQGGYIDVHGKINCDFPAGNAEARPAILALVQDLNDVIEKTKAYLADTYKDRIHKICRRPMASQHQGSNWLFY